MAAATQYGLTNLVGRDAQFILAAFIDSLAPDGALREEAIARAATIDTLTDLFERFDVGTNGIEALNNMTEEDVRDIVSISITNYVSERFLEELTGLVEQESVSETEANRFAGEIKEFIETNVRLDIEGIDPLTFDWQSAEGRAFVAEQYDKAYELLGGVQ